LFHSAQLAGSAQIFAYSGILQVDSGLDCYVTNSATRPLEQPLFVIRFGAMIEADIHVSGVNGDVN